LDFAHYGRGFRRLNISYYFPKRWISRAGSVVWLPRSPLDFFLWGTLKQKIYVVSINDQSLKQRIVQECEEITDAQCQSVTRSLIDNCLRARDHHFEQNN